MVNYVACLIRIYGFISRRLSFCNVQAGRFRECWENSVMGSSHPAAWGSGRRETRGQGKMTPTQPAYVKKFYIAFTGSTQGKERVQTFDGVQGHCY